jgi:hypothetical protein
MFMTTACLALLGAITFADNVTYDFDRSADFSRFRTFAWVRGNDAPDELSHRRIVRAVDAQLMSRGFARVETTSSADVLVAYHASFNRDLQISGFSSGWGAYRFGGDRSGSARVQEVVVGTLAVDIMDARTRNLVWRGMATKEVDVDADAGKRDKNINKALEKIFKHYPPASR